MSRDWAQRRRLVASLFPSFTCERRILAFLTLQSSISKLAPGTMLRAKPLNTFPSIRRFSLPDKGASSSEHFLIKLMDWAALITGPALWAVIRDKSTGNDQNLLTMVAFQETFVAVSALQLVG